jgi:hypothetical protein
MSEIVRVIIMRKFTRPTERVHVRRWITGRTETTRQSC